MISDPTLTDPNSSYVCAPPDASDQLVEQVLLKLKALGREATLAFALSVGKLVITNLYRGNLDNWRSRDPRKSASLRRLAQHPDLPMSSAVLYRSVAMYEMFERLDLGSLTEISTSHIRLVLPLCPEAQARLLRQAQDERWTVRRLDDEVAALLRENPGARCVRGGLRRRSGLTRTMHVVERCAQSVDDLLGELRDGGEELSPESQRVAVDAVRTATQTCTLLEARLARTRPGARTDPPPPLPPVVGGLRGR